MAEIKDLIRENNFILREVKQLRGNEPILPENIDILEDLAEIHEIKDFRPKNNLEQVNPSSNISNKIKEFEIKLESESRLPNTELNIEDNEEPILENENIISFIENIFEKIEKNNLEDINELKMTFNTLDENEQTEVIEGIKIKLDNEEQDNRFNEILKLLY